MGFSSPLSDAEREDLRWYLEDYLPAPYAVYEERGASIEVRLPEWGERLFQSVFATGLPGRDAYLKARLAEERLGFTITTLGVIKRGEVVEADKGVGMLRAEHFPAQLQRLAVQRLGLTITALGSIKKGEVVQASKGIRVLRAEVLLSILVGFLGVFQCLGITTLPICPDGLSF